MSSPSSLVLMTPETLNEIVTLYVGKKRKKYIVHKKILCDQSEFFDAAFNHGFEDATERGMYLPEDDLNAIAALIEYTYRGSLPKVVANSGADVFSLYYLADKIYVPSLMDRLMDLVGVPRVSAGNSWIRLDANLIKTIYERTHAGSKLRLLACVITAFKLSIGGIDKKGTRDHSQILESHPEFFFNVFKVIGKYGRAIWVRSNISKAFVEEFERCYFHAHGSYEACYAKVNALEQREITEGYETASSGT